MRYDVIIIGGGPAGIIAAGRAGELGARVLLLEKNERLGVKLLITGGGRCNLTNYILDPKILASNFGPSGKFLISAFNKFGAKDIIDLLSDYNVPTKIKKNNQVFPLSNKATDVSQALKNYLKQSRVEIKLGSQVKKIITRQSNIAKIELADGQILTAANYIIATGGKSYPATGSTGDGFAWLKKLGHHIIPLRPSLVPIITKEKFIKQIEGVSLEQAKICLLADQKKIISFSGDLIFTSQGLSGPAILNLSRYVNGGQGKKQWLEIDFVPEISQDELDKKFQNILASNGNKQLKNILDIFIPQRLANTIINLIPINPEILGNAIDKEKRKKIIKLLKSFQLEIKGPDDYSRAMVTAGGIDLKEVDSKNMRSKIISNLFIAGEILDIDGPTGGFNLQACWSTGYVAGENAIQKNN